jgi:hypothetical protein
VLRKYNSKNMAEIDYIIYQNNIGKIVNLSQLLNSYYWEIKANSKSNEYQSLLNEIYSKTSTLSSLSQIEIDKSKKLFENLNINQLLGEIKKITNAENEPLLKTTQQKIKKTMFNSEEGNRIVEKQEKMYGKLNKSKSKNDIEYIKISNQVLNQLPDELKYRKIKLSNGKEVDYVTKLEKPTFFKYCSVDKNVERRDFKTPMDYLESTLSKTFPSVDNDNKVPVVKITDMVLGKGKYNDKQIKNIYSIANKANLLTNDTYKEYGDTSNNDEKAKSKEIELNSIKENAISKLKDMKINSATMYFLFEKMYGECSKDDAWHVKLKKIRLTLVEMLYAAQPELMSKMFKPN